MVKVKEYTMSTIELKQEIACVKAAILSAEQSINTLKHNLLLRKRELRELQKQLTKRKETK